MKKLVEIGAQKSGYVFGQVNGLTSIAYLLLGFALVGGLGVILVGEFSKMANASHYTKAVSFLNNVLDAYSTLGGFLGIVVLALVIVLIVGVVQSFRQ